MHVSATEFAVLALVAAAGGAVQGSIGFGQNLVLVPVVALVVPEAVPGALVTLGIPLTLIMAVREWHGIDRSGLGWIVLGRVPGTVVGVVIAMPSIVRLALRNAPFVRAVPYQIAIAQIAGCGVLLADQLGYEAEGIAVQVAALGAALAGALLALQLPVAQGIHVVPGDTHSARAGPVEGADQMQQGGLPGSGRADDADQLARPDPQRHLGERGHAARVALGDLGQLDHPGIPTVVPSAIPLPLT